jgi:hypothetical protein
MLIASDAVAQLRITGHVEEVNMCRRGRQADILVKLRLIFKNSGPRRIIVFTSTMISGNALTASTAQPQEREWSHNLWVIRKERIPDTPSSAFAVLESGDQVEVRLNDRIFTTLLELKRARYLHVRLFTPWSEEEAAEMKSKWKEYGDLWRQALTPEPIPLRFSARMSVVQCPK